MMRASMADGTLIASLENRDCFDHPVERVEVLETHISWVVLTGKYAYKIKKPVDLGFLDFSTLEKRRHYCEEELRLNSRMAPNIYLAVTTITGSPEHPKINGKGEAIEYAVKMKEFPQEAALDRMIVQGGIGRHEIDEIASAISHFHKGVGVAPVDSSFGTPEVILQAAMDNFALLKKLVDTPNDMAEIGEIEKWCALEHEERAGDFIERKNGGFIRECHGDIHLGNMALVDGKLMIFDCIEFNEYLHWIDVINDACFLVMDLEDHKRPDLARRFLNEYLEATGDYSGLAVLQYYLSYRAMVRAKVAMIKMREPGASGREKKRNQNEYRCYLALALGYTHAPKPSLIITRGVSGSGKSSYAQSIVERVGAVRIRADVTRKRLFGLDPLDKSRSPLKENIYTPQANEKTYKRLADIATTILKAGYTVVVDASFLKLSDRKMFYELAKRLNAPFSILDFKLGYDELCRRIEKRQKSGADPSEASIEVLETQLKSREDLTLDEMKFVTTIEG